jgi:hypothetical protein
LLLPVLPRRLAYWQLRRLQLATVLYVDLAAVASTHSHGGMWLEAALAVLGRGAQSGAMPLVVRAVT